MKKIYLSHPYGGKEINRDKARRIAAWYRKEWEREGKDYELVNPLDVLAGCSTRNDEDQMLGLAVELMRKCDMVLFAPGWRRSRGCRYEHMVARKEGLPRAILDVEISA